ncbi:diguanylate cyclase [Gudongella sp. DL1XJH-153]|uniref:diguanylate cyclase n=1 Tax=Gudongella sp. DL1XJH-153 TaxID=3409804 RepID=UPI003BB755D1
MLKRILDRYRELDQVRKRYLGFGVTLFIIFAVIVSGIFIGRIYSLGETYAEYTRNEIIHIKKDFLKDTVTNTISAVEKIRNRQERLLENKITHIMGYFEAYPDLELNAIIKYLSLPENSELLDIVIEDEAGTVIFSSPTGLAFSGVLLEDETVEYSQEFQYGPYKISLLILRDTVKKQIEEELREKIYREIYFQDAYMWVNEVIDYDGGDDYGIRLIHPNLKDTEGMSISTDMEDIAGNLPYLEELEGIRMDGEVFYTYNFKKLDDDEIGEKISYARLYEDYNWILAMGVYYDTIDAYYESAKNASEDEIAASVGILLGSGFLVLLVGMGMFLILEERYFRMSNMELKEELATDELTDAKSRRAGMKRLKEKFQKFSNNGCECALFLMDLDDFKHINDTYGHDVGDKVLYEVVKSIKASIRDSDTVYRWGGEEFVILVDGIGPTALETFMSKVLAAVEKTEVLVENKEVGITTSIGATYFREDDISFEDALKRADMALYESKKNGKGRGTIRQ